ncbi:hypothetical protein [Nonomuraea typhae]|uniref:hypothetical protein n=1 Tax=Nonomuraea typhae TaxID=2603600 RepID=UPI0012F89F0D|nr:hypothetical protein [Nonomuraea typhae]
MTSDTTFRAFLWIVLTACAAVNVIANNILSGTTWIGYIAGGIALACIAGLITSHVRGRKQGS